MFAEGGGLMHWLLYLALYLFAVIAACFAWRAFIARGRRVEAQARRRVERLYRLSPQAPAQAFQWPPRKPSPEAETHLGKAQIGRRAA